MTLILRGTADTIPADVLAAHIRAARSGQQRLVIVDEGSQLVRRHIDYDRDRLIDAGHTNWDIFADHIERLELAEASEAILHQDRSTGTGVQCCQHRAGGDPLVSRQ